jgi:glycosyltransferase involved in cell wall biosynthesis
MAVAGRRVLLLNQFYPPDVAPTGRYLHTLGREFVRRGHEVRVLCSRGSYEGGERYATEEVLHGVRVRRVAASRFGRGWAGRAASYAAFLLLGAVEAIRGPRPDIVVCLTTPPYLGLVGRALRSLRGTADAHWVMDVYPDALGAHGLRGASFAHRALAAVARWQWRGARAVVALGPFMRDRLARHVAGPTHLEWIPLWCEETVELQSGERARVRAELGGGHEDLVLLYSGNMGLGHSLEEFLEAARRLGEAGPLWAFAGGGARRAEVEAFTRAHPAARVRLLSYAPWDEAGARLAAADVHLVSLQREWQGVIVPSKVQGAFAVGRPVLFVGPAENEAARWIEESGGGWRVDEGDVAGLLRAIDEARDAGERGRRGEAALAFARDRFDGAANCGRLADLIEQACPA